MGGWSRAELEAAHDRFLAAAADAVASGDWTAWAGLFTADARYVEHTYGTFHGRDAIRAWVTATLPRSPGVQFPVEWRVVDDERGWVVAHVWVRMPDPDGLGPYQSATWTLLHADGDGRWSSVEELYHPGERTEVLVAWQEARRRSLAGGT